MSVSPLPRLLRAKALSRALPCLTTARTAPLRPFHSTEDLLTDGVYKELAEMRVRTPWIEALRRKKEQENSPTPSDVEPVKVDLTPKKMSDSYVRLVLPLSVSGPNGVSACRHAM